MGSKADEKSPGQLITLTCKLIVIVAVILLEISEVDLLQQGHIPISDGLMQLQGNYLDL